MAWKFNPRGSLVLEHRTEHALKPEVIADREAMPAITPVANMTAEERQNTAAWFRAVARLAAREG